MSDYSSLESGALSILICRRRNWQLVKVANNTGYDIQAFPPGAELPRTYGTISWEEWGSRDPWDLFDFCQWDSEWRAAFELLRELYFSYGAIAFRYLGPEKCMLIVNSPIELGMTFVTAPTIERAIAQAWLRAYDEGKLETGETEAECRT